MSSKNIASFDKCTATDIIDYFDDIIGNDLEEIIYSLYDARLENSDKAYIDDFINTTNLTNINEISKLRKNMIYRLLQQSTQNQDENIKFKILYEIYARYRTQLTKPENKNKLKKLRDIILEDREAVVLSHHDKGKLRYDIITRDEPKSIDSIVNNQTRELIEIALDSIAALEDLDQIIKYPMLASNIIRKCLIEFMYELGARNSDVEEVTQEPVFKDNNKILNIEELKTIMGDQEILNLFNLYVLDYLRHNLQFIDTDTLLKNSVARLILGIRINSGEEIEEIELKENFEEEEVQSAMRNSIRCLKKFYNELEKRPNSRNGAYQISGRDGREIITIDMDYIEQFLQRCTQYKYFTDEDIELIHNQIKQGIIPEDMQVRQIANISIDDLVTASKSYESTEEDEEKKAKLLSCSLELIKYLRETGAISNDEKLLEMYLNGELNIDILDSVEMPEILEENYIEKFKTIYEETEKDDEESTHKKKLIRYSELYKRLMSETKLDKDNLVEKLVEQYGEERGNKILIDLYNLGMINLEDCINWAGTDILKNLFEMENRNIQPNQINNLYHNNILSINEIADLILMIPNVEERYITIASIFPEMSESEERQELIYKTIKVEKALNNKTKTDGNGIIHPVIPTDYNKHITDSTYRFNLIRLFDKEYFMEMTADGHAIIKLPKFKKVMIEKMLDTKKEEGYGAATYIVDEDYYLANEDDIKVEGKVNRKELIRALKMEKADRFSHIVEQSDGKENKNKKRVSWGEQLKRYFTGLSQSRYTEEEEKEIDNAIENINNSVRIIGVGK